MKRAVQVFAIVLAFSLLMQAQTQGRKKRVAVLDFEYGTVRSYVSGLFGTDVDVGKGMADLIVKHLVRDGSYTVVERKMIDRILAEQNLSTSDRANPSTAAQLGKILGVDAMIVGSITQFGSEDKNVKVGGAGGGWGGFGVGGVGRKNSKAIVTMDARMVDIDTAEILAVADGKGESKRSSTSLLGGGGSWRGWGAGAVDFGSSNFQETILGEAVKIASENLSAGLIAAAPKLRARVIKVDGLVAAVEGSDVVLNVGGRAGLKAGDQLSIERVTREIKDPATGKVLRRLSAQVATVKCDDVDEASAVCTITGGAGVKVGDVAKTTTE